MPPYKRITGGAVGLGRSLVLGFAAEGADIAFSYHQSEKEAIETESKVRASGVRCLARKVDLRRVEHIRATAGEIDETFGRMDVLINNVGMNIVTSVVDAELSLWNKIIESNLNGTFLCSRKASRMMREQY